MPPKAANFYIVVYLNEEIQNCDSKIILAPISYINENFVSYPEYPHSEDDAGLIKSFLAMKPAPPIPDHWKKYKCLLMGSFATLKGSFNFADKLKQDKTLLTRCIARALAENLQQAKHIKSLQEDKVSQET